MALERIGLGGVATLDPRQFVQGADQARDSLGRFLKKADQAPATFNRMSQSFARASAQIARGARQIGTGVRSLGAGLRNAALGFAPLAFAVAAGIKTAASFEKQMSAVGAITRASAGDMALLADKAEEMGIKSVFSATESAQAMEFMARSGASTTQIIGGLTGVMAAAAAEGIDLATSADIIAQTTKIMGRTWEQAGNTADVLALTSASTNTNIRSLGETMRFGGQVAADLGIRFEETAAIFGTLADAGLRGSIGGTSLVNMLNKLSKPSQKSAALMKKWGINIGKANIAGGGLADIIAKINKRVQKIPGAFAKSGVATELFGIRGRRAFSALAKVGPETLKKLTANLLKASDGIGAAQEAALKRLDNFSGAFVLFSSSLQAASIKIFKPLLEPFKEAIRGVTLALNNVLLPLGRIRRAFSDTGKGVVDVTALTEQFGVTSVDIAFGVNDAIDTMLRTWDKFTTIVKAVSNVLSDTFGGDTVRQMAKWAVLIAIAAGVIAPLLLGFVAVGFAISGITAVIGGLISIVAGFATIIGGAAGFIITLLSGPVLVALGLVALAFFALRREGESVGQTMIRVWGSIRDGAVALWENTLKPIISGFMQRWAVMAQFIGEVWDTTFGEVVIVLQGAWSAIKTIFTDVFGAWGSGTGIMAEDWMAFGQGAATFIGLVISGIIKTVGFLIKAFTFVAVGLLKVLSLPFMLWEKFVQGVLNNITAFMEDGFLGGMINLAKTLFNVLTIPFRAMLQLAVKAIELIPGIKLPSGIKEFLEKGFQTKQIFEEAKKPELVAVAATAAETVAPRIAPPTVAEEKGILGRIQDEIAAVTQLKAEEKQKAAETPKTEVKIDLTDKRTLDINNQLCVDNEEVSIARERHKQEIQDRAGFKATPWQRRIAVESGAAPLKKAG